MSSLLQNKVEAFLNKGEIIMFEMKDNIAVMTIFFGKAEFSIYSNPKNHKEFICKRPLFPDSLKVEF